jgi:hypothetical protein
MEDSTMYGLIIVGVLCWVYRDAIMKFFSSKSTQDTVKSVANTVVKDAKAAANTTAKNSTNFKNYYKGCFKDLNKVPRFSKQTNNLMTLEGCGNLALANNSQYFALQNSNGLNVGTCHYGNPTSNPLNYSSIGIAKNCVTNWNGNVYGGKLANSVYSTPGFITPSLVPATPVKQGFEGPHGGVSFGRITPNY